MRDPFDTAGLPLPALPADLAERLGPPTMAGRETAGWPATLDFQARVAQGLQQARPARAWVGLSACQGRQLAAVAAVVTPQLAVFVRKRWSVVPEAQAHDRRRLVSTWTLMNHLLDCADEAGRRGHWPASRRLLLVDDDFGSRRWGWGRDRQSPESVMAADPMALLNAAAEADRLLRTPAAQANDGLWNEAATGGRVPLLASAARSQ